jgi:hypothetical protein
VNKHGALNLFSALSLYTTTSLKIISFSIKELFIGTNSAKAITTIILITGAFKWENESFKSASTLSGIYNELEKAVSKKITIINIKRQCIVSDD